MALAVGCASGAPGGASAPTAAAPTSTHDTVPLRPPVTQTTAPCDPDATTQDLITCAYRDKPALDASLAELVDRLRMAVGPAHAAEVDRAQAAWESFVVATCGVTSELVGGSYGRVEVAACSVAELAHRVETLRDQLVRLG